MFIFVSITTGTWLCWRLLNSQINKVCHNQIYHLLYLLLLLSDIKLHEVQNVYDHIDGSMNQKNLCCQKSYLDSHQHHKNPIILHCVGLYQYLTFIQCVFPNIISQCFKWFNKMCSITVCCVPVPLTLWGHPRHEQALCFYASPHPWVFSQDSCVLHF